MIDISNLPEDMHLVTNLSHTLPREAFDGIEWQEEWNDDHGPDRQALLPEEPDGWNWWSIRGYLMLVQMPQSNRIYHTIDFRQPGKMRVWTHKDGDPKAMSFVDFNL